jgi:hypothetical protein
MLLLKSKHFFEYCVIFANREPRNAAPEMANPFSVLKVMVIFASVVLYMI